MFLTTKEFTSEHVLIYAKQQVVKVKFLAFGNSGSNDEKKYKKRSILLKVRVKILQLFFFYNIIKKLEERWA